MGKYPSFASEVFVLIFGLHEEDGESLQTEIKREKVSLSSFSGYFVK